MALGQPFRQEKQFADSRLSFRERMPILEAIAGHRLLLPDANVPTFWSRLTTNKRLDRRKGMIVAELLRNKQHSGG
jgi:hypothetical protein